MSHHHSGSGDAPTREGRAARLLDDVAAIEDRLDPGPAKRGQLVADVITLAQAAGDDAGDQARPGRERP